MMRAVLFLLPLALSAQTITYSTASIPQDLSAETWRVMACLPPGTQGVTLPGGLFFQHLAEHGAKPLLYAESIAVFDEAPSRSIASRIVEYSGWAMAGGSFLMTTETIKVSQQMKIGVSAAAGFLTVGVPLVRQRIPKVSPLRDQLIGPWLTVPGGSCASGVLLGDKGVDFKVVL